MLARACAEVAARVPHTERDESVFLVVNDVDLGVVPVVIWEQVRERLLSILDEHVSFAESDVQRPEARAAEPTPAEPTVRSGSRPRAQRVLIAEHDASFRAQLLAHFADDGFEVIGVGDGAQALRQLAARPAQVLVAEFELPKVAGDELLERARAARGSAVRVGVLIGVSLPQVLVPRCAAADIVLGQPFAPRSVVERVRAALGKRARRDTG
jgi:CheY-like chemotaxis protein